MTRPESQDQAFLTLVRAIAAAHPGASGKMLSAQPGLAKSRASVGATRQTAAEFWIEEIGHYLYRGDTALHVAAAAHNATMVSQLLEKGAEVRARNRRGAEPLHYAADGQPASQRWNPIAQAETIRYLIKFGADPNCVDQSGVAPLHRAIRTRCAAAVLALLEGGADPKQPNKNGSAPRRLATRNTGRGGSGTPENKTQQREILEILHQWGSGLTATRGSVLCPNAVIVRCGRDSPAPNGPLPAPSFARPRNGPIAGACRCSQKIET
jgi:hypothetical protein